METSKFKTNIKCAACIAKVTPYLNESLGSGHWEVDIADPSKLLTVKGEISESIIQEALKKAGYKAEKL